MVLVPASVPAFVERAPGMPADCVLFDVQDAVIKEDGAKRAARELVAKTLRAGGFQARETCVRVNNPGSPWFVDDITQLIEAGIDSIMLTRSYGLDDILWAEDAIRAAGAQRDVDIQIEVDMPSCLLDLPDIARHASLVTALWIGPGDFGLEMWSSNSGPVRNNEPDSLDFYRGQILTHARANGWNCGGDLGLGNPNDVEAVRAAFKRARAWGFDGSLIQTPRHIEIANEVYGVTAEELAWARNIVEKWDTQNDGADRDRGMRTIDGRNVFMPSYEYARRVVNYAAVLAGDPEWVERYRLHGPASFEYIEERPQNRKIRRGGAAQGA
jgi:citrate lyase subunit beta/citryl-CoA lyase